MANQIIIDIGAVANDGTGDPLRTAFNYVNNNFSNVWNTGLPTANVAFSNNRLLTVNTNANLVLAPNGIGKVVANVDIVPNMNTTHSLGAINNRWNTVYTRFLNVSSDVEFSGDLTVNGNLTVEGDTIQIGNIVTDTKTIQLSNTASTANAANGSGITVGANDNIATMLYSSSSNVWTVNIGVSTIGNITAPYFIGNGSQLTGISSYSNANAVALLANFGSNTISTTGNITSGNLTVSSAGNTWIIAGQRITGPGGAYWLSNPDQDTDDIVSAPGSNIRIQAINVSNVIESQISLTNTDIDFAIDNGISRGWKFSETGVTEFPLDIVPVVAGGAPANIGNVSNPWNNAYITGNITAGNIIPLSNNVQSLGNATNQWADLWVSNSTIYINSVPITLGAGNVLTVDGNAVLQNDSNTSINTTGNITADYFFGTSLNGATPSATVSLNAFSPDGNTVSIRAQGNTSTAVIETYASGPDTTNTWTFGIDGNLTLPNGGDIILENGDGVIGKNGDDLLISWDDEELILRSVNGDVQLEADNDIEIRSGYNFNTGDYGSRWIFNDNGELQSIPQDTANSSSYNGGYIQFVGNSSGDGYGYTTIVLRPDETAGGDQNIVIDPTAPNHIHIRAGGTQDNSSAQLFLGGETSHYSVGAGANPPLYIKANDNQWTYGTDGGLTVPSISTGETGEQERAEIRGTRTIVGEPGVWSTYIPGHSMFGNVAWTASSSSIQSARITFVIQTNGTAFNWEQFDVAVCKLDSANAVVSVSNRIRQNSAIDYTEVSAYENEGYLTVWLNPADGQTSGYVNYHAVEFSIMPD